MVHPIVMPVVSDIAELGEPLGRDQDATLHTCWTGMLRTGWREVLPFSGKMGTLLRDHFQED